MKTLIAIILLAATACASPAPQGAPSPVAATARHRAGQLSRAELDTQRGRKLGEAIRAIDPSLLMDRGEPLQVWVDGTSYAISVLETMPANDVQAVTRASAADLRQMFGERATGAGLVIVTRGGNAR